MKRLMTIFLAGILVFGLASCGSKTKDVAAQFKNSVFMGDSITEGFAINETLPKENVMAGAGATAGYIYETYMDALAQKKPDNIFIMLGSDDMLWPQGDPKALFESDMTKLINKIKDELPKAKIYLESILPVTQEALNEEPRYKNIDNYNALLKELARKLSVNYVDIGTLAMNDPNLFAEDGIHFKKEFYPLWLTELSKSL